MTRAHLALSVLAAAALAALGYWDAIERPASVLNAGVCAIVGWLLLQCLWVQHELRKMVAADRAQQWELMRQTTGRGVEVTNLKQDLAKERAARKSEADRARAEVGRLKGIVMDLQELVGAYQRHGYEGASTIAPTLAAVRDGLSQFGHSLDLGPDTVPDERFHSMRGQL